MKKSLWILLLLVIACMFTLSACDSGDTPQTPNDTPSGTTDNTTGSETDAHVHAFGEWTTVKDATCTAKGEQKRSCSCGEKETQSIDATGHTEVIDAAVAATCTTDGKTEGKHCSVCSETLIAQNNISASHTDGEWKIDTNATCTEDGTKHQECAVCSASIKTEKISATGHTDGEWITDAEATCTVDGSKHRVCSVCNVTTKTEVITAKGHNFSETLTSRDCANPAKINYACSKCSYTYEEEVKSPKIALEHKGTSSATMNGYGRFSFSYTVTSSDGYGKILYKYELFASSTATVPATTIDFTEETSVSVSYTGYEDTINEYIYKISAKDEAGNLSIYWFKLEDCSVIKSEDASIVKHSYENETCVCGRNITEDAVATYDLSKNQDGSIIAYLVNEGSGKKAYILGSGEMKDYFNIVATGHTITPFNKENDIKEVYFSNQITSIGSFLFYFCQGITTIEIPSSVTTIGDRAFVGCASIKTLVLHEGLLTIGEQAFLYTSISEVQLPNSIQYIGEEAFSETDLEGEFIIPANVQFVGKAVIAHTRISGISVDAKNTKYHSSGNCLIETGTKTIIAGCQSSNILTDSGVEHIGDNAFEGCSLTTINIPNTIISIGSFAFSGNNLNSLYIPNSVVRIDDYAFFLNTNLTIRCETTIRPENWGDEWNLIDYYRGLYASVNWGYTE